MAIVKMKKIKLFSVRSQKDSLLNDLMQLGCVEFSEPEIFALAKKESSELDRFRSEQASLNRGLELLNQYAYEKSKMFEQRPEISAQTFLDESELAGRLELSRRLETLDSQIKRLSALEVQQSNLIESLLSWKDLTLPLESTGTKSVSVVLGTIPSSVTLDPVDAALAEAVPEAQLLRVSSIKEQHCLMLVCLKTKMTDAAECLRVYGFSVASFKNLSGTAFENISEAEKRLTEMRDEKRALSEEIAAEAPSKNDLKLCIDLLSTKISKAEAAERLLRTESTDLLVGWFPAPAEKKLSSVLAKYDCAWETSDPEPEETEDVPIFIKNNRISAPLGMVTNMYSPPAYNGIDANPLIMPFFCLFFGMMYADLGYGLVLTSLCLLFRKKAKPRGGTKQLIELMILCGISTMIFGVVTGSFFGNAIASIAQIFGYPTPVLPSFLNLLTHPLIDPSKDMIMILVISLGLGFIQIVVGMAINAYMLIRDGHLWDAVFDIGSWWLLFAGIAVGALGGTWYVCYAGVAALILTQGRAKKGILGKLFGGLGSLYNITSYLSDILSYSRLMALMLAGSVIASIVNMLGAMPGSIIAFIPIFLFGHAFNMAINIVGTYVHTSRLQYLEYFGKFYKDGGREFSPLRINTNYVDII